jgi:fermentation-respiration switch protein FrsA (DUF1100 family)
MQQQDYLDVFDYAASIPDVDGDRIAYWGTSFSGGNVIVAAAVDKRMKAAVVQCPFVSGDLAVVAVAPMVPMLLAERAGIKQGLEPSVIPIMQIAWRLRRRGRRKRSSAMRKRTSTWRQFLRGDQTGGRIR